MKVNNNGIRFIFASHENILFLTSNFYIFTLVNSFSHVLIMLEVSKISHSYYNGYCSKNKNKNHPHYCMYYLFLYFYLLPVMTLIIMIFMNSYVTDSKDNCSNNHPNITSIYTQKKK